jgi:hypothetical protein
MITDKAINTTFRQFLRNIYQLFLEALFFIKNHKSFIVSLLIAQLFADYIIEILEKLSLGTYFTIVISILNFLIFLIFNITLIKYMQRNGEFSFQIFRSDLKKLLLPIAAVSILTGLFVSIGFLFLIIPGIYLSFSFLLIIYFAICLNQPFSIASENSSKLMDGYKFYFFILVAIISLLFFIPIFIVIYVEGPNSTTSIISLSLVNLISSITEIIITITLYLFWKQQLAIAKKEAQETLPE